MKEVAPNVEAAVCLSDDIAKAHCEQCDYFSGEGEKHCLKRKFSKDVPRLNIQYICFFFLLSENLDKSYLSS